MNKDISASASGKTSTQATCGSTPFDQITSLEKQENKRVQKEIDAMEKEREEVEQALKEKKEIGDQEIKDAARKELLEYRETELSLIIETSEKEATTESAAIQKAFESNQEGIVKDLLTKMISKDSPLHQS